MIKKFFHLSRCSTPASLTSCSSFLIGLSLYLRKFLRMTKFLNGLSLYLRKF